MRSKLQPADRLPVESSLLPCLRAGLAALADPRAPGPTPTSFTATPPIALRPSAALALHGLMRARRARA